MGKYGSGITMKRMFELEREEVRHALDWEVLVDFEERIYKKTPLKEDINEVILSAFDNAVYWAMQMNAHGRAMDRFIKEVLNIDYHEHWKELFTLMAEEEAREYAEEMPEEENNEQENAVD